MNFPILLTLLILSFNSFSQEFLDTVFFDQDWNRVSKFDSSGYYGFKDYDTLNKGLATYYYSTGELHSKQNEINNLKNGYCIWYFRNGNKWYEGHFADDEPTGEQIRYNEQGIIEQSSVPSSASKDSNGKVYDLTKPFTVDSLVVLSQPEVLQLYRWYKNIIDVGLKKGCEFDLAVSCPSCDTIYNIDFNRFIVVPRHTRTATIEVYNIKDPNNFVLLHRKKYRVLDLPNPSIYIGGSSEGEPISWKTKKMFVKYPPGNWIEHKFEIVDWTITIQNKEYSGKGDTLTNDVQNEIKQLEIGARIDLKARITGEYNQERTVNSHYYYLRGGNNSYIIEE